MEKKTLTVLAEEVSNQEIFLNEEEFEEAFLNTFKEYNIDIELNSSQEESIRKFAFLRIIEGMSDRTYIEDPVGFIQQTNNEGRFRVITDIYKSLIDS